MLRCRVAFQLTSRLAAVQPGPVQTQSLTTLVKREKTLSDAAPPDVTSPPTLLYKRDQPDTRKSSIFGGCALRSTITFANWLLPQDFTNRYPAASSYFLVSLGSDILSTSTDAQNVEHTSTTCVAGYIYSTSDYVSYQSFFKALQYDRRWLHCNRNTFD